MVPIIVWGKNETIYPGREQRTIVNSHTLGKFERFAFYTLSSYVYTYALEVVTDADLFFMGQGSNGRMLSSQETFLQGDAPRSPS